jgi:hypothetical protein
VIGDARLSLQQRSDVHDVIVLDAFSSDSIPIHLLTREAVTLYLSRLSEDGALAIHISNNHLDLRPVVAGVMRDLGLAGPRAVSGQSRESRQRKVRIALGSARQNRGALGVLARDKRWQHLQPGTNRTWTDDFSNIWSVIQWRH